MAGSRRQLRFALSMNGGVSLAVWIGGAVSEIDRLRRGDAFWGSLLDACGYEPNAQVDVMTGASAGGLNAVLYAQAIRNDRPYDDDIARLWEETAAIEKLVKPAPTARDPHHDPRAILKGQYFLHQLESKLTELGRGAADVPEGAQALAVFASATLVAANPVKYRDVPAASIDEGRSDAYFHVTRRGPASRGLDGFASAPGSRPEIHPEDAVLPDAEPPNTARALALIGRATCSLPVLFEPIPFAAKHFGGRLVNAFTPDRDHVQIVDGGVIDNVPIARAIRAIASSHASTRTRRVLLYLHPDPSVVADQPEEPTTAIAVGRALFGKRKESLREDIDLLRSHNAAVERRNVIAQTLLATIDGTHPAAPPVSDVEAQRSIAIGTLLRAALDPAAELAWHPPDVARVAPLLDGLSQLSRDGLRRVLEREGAADLLVAQRPRRVVGHLLRLVRDAERAADDAATASPVPADASIVDLSEVKQRLYDLLLLADLLHAYQLARFVGYQPAGADPADALLTACDAQHRAETSTRSSDHAAEAAVRRLRHSVAELRSVAAGRSIGELTDAQWRALATWTLSSTLAGPAPLQPTGAPNTVSEPLLVDLLWHELRTVLAQIPARMDVGTAGNERSDQAVTALNQLKDRSITIEQLDDLLLPLAAEPIASDQAIEFVRVAGNIDTPASRQFANAQELASLGGRVTGVQLHHLGAFFQTSWRTNDFRWGRLDAVPSLLDAVLDRQAIATLRAWAETSTTPLAAVVRASNVADPSEASPRTADERLRELLVEHRQAQLLTEFLAPPPTDATDATDATADSPAPAPDDPPSLTTITASPPFQAWRLENRSIQHLLGTRSLTSTGLRASITAWRVLTAPLAVVPRLVLWFLRPLVLGLVGVVLAGRRAAAAIALTLCVLAAPRASSAPARWTVFALGVLVTAGAIWFVEAKIRPRAAPGHGWVDSRRYLYGLTVLAVAAGAILCARSEQVQANRWAWFAVAPGVAGLNAWLLFFWMRRHGRFLMIAMSGGLYALWSWNATGDPFAGSAFGRLIHPLRGIAVCWLLVVAVTTSLLGHLPDRWLRPADRPGS